MKLTELNMDLMCQLLDRGAQTAEGRNPIAEEDRRHPAIRATVEFLVDQRWIKEEGSGMWAATCAGRFWLTRLSCGDTLAFAPPSRTSRAKTAMKIRGERVMNTCNECLHAKGGDGRILVRGIPVDFDFDRAELAADADEIAAMLAALPILSLRRWAATDGAYRRLALAESACSGPGTTSARSSYFASVSGSAASREPIPREFCNVLPRSMPLLLRDQGRGDGQAS